MIIRSLESPESKATRAARSPSKKLKKLKDRHCEVRSAGAVDGPANSS